MIKNDTQFMNDRDDKFEELLARWLSGELTEAELQALEAEEGQETLAQLKEVAEASTHLAPPPMDHDASWSRLTAAMEEEVDSTIPFTPKESSPTPPPKSGPRWSWYALGVGIAATIVLLLLFVVPQGNPYNVELIADQGKIRSVNLPDNSAVELQAGSTLRYSDTDWDKQREVELEGEAYFKVTKGQRFSVIGANGRVEVLGTRFMVTTSPDAMEVVCYSGKVRVSNPEGEELTILNPGSQFGIYEGGTHLREHKEEIPAWAIKDIPCKNAPLKEVLESMGDEFDVILTCENCENKRFTGSFNNRNLSTNLDKLCIVFGMTWEQQPDGQYKIR